MAARPSTPSSWHFRDESGGFAIIYGGKPLKRKRAAGAPLVASISYPDGDDKTVIKVSIINREVKIVRTINVALLMTSRITSVFNDSAREG